MLTIDAQVHAYERDTPKRPWAAVLEGPPAVTGDDMVAAMDAVGVDGALLVSPYTMYRYDASYALEVYARHPGRFGLIKPLDPNDPAVTDTIADRAKTEGAVGVRLMVAYGDPIEPGAPGVKRIFDAAARHELPLNILAWGRLDIADALAALYPDTRLVIDHLGLKQPFKPPVPQKPFADLAKVLDLAKYENVAIKITGACTLSRQPYPYDDIWDPLCRIFDAYGFARCLWGTDWTRAVNLLTYRQGVEPFRLTDRLSDGERAELMGGTLQTIYKWAPSKR